MENITINENSLIKATAIIRVSEEMLQIYRNHECVDVDDLRVYKDLIWAEEYRLKMAYRLLRALGLDYDADTGMITKRGGQEDV